jgi:hydroxymethylbilane synthase
VKPVRIGTRGSALARWQSNHVRSALSATDPALRTEIVEIRTAGDELPELPLEDLEGIGFFTTAIERALLAGEIDIAVHSYKDLPVLTSPELTVAAVPARAPVEDALCARDGMALADLPAGSRIGTSSARRAAQLRALRRDLVLEPLRGNVPTRLWRVASHALDAVVLARAGLDRLGLAEYITQVFSLEAMLPAPAQGALAVQARRADAELLHRLRALDDEPTRLAVEAERHLLYALGGGCSVPVGAHATVDARGVRLLAGVFDPGSGRALIARSDGRTPVEAGDRAARDLMAQGADVMLSAYARVPRVPQADA